MRSRAIFNCLKHGLLPWWMYEDEKHYECSYFEHLMINLKYAYRWATFNETEEDIKFELQQ